jgi:predicted ATPase
MIEAIRASNFKCLSELEFHAAPLTLLTGTNSVGKSSILQSLLLMRLAALNLLTKPAILPLNGPYGLRLGEFADILRHDVNSEDGSDISISVSEGGELYNLLLTADSEEARYANFYLENSAPPAFRERGLGRFTYLTSDRFGPQSWAHIQSAPKDHIEIGFQGQNIADVINRCERDEVLQALEHPDARGQRFLKHVEAWLSTLVPGVEIRAESTQDFDLAAIRFKRGGLSSEWERPTNTGFGVSYCLAIVVAGLVGKESSTIIVESPEAHLHPSAQSAMGSFLARLAAAGIQVFIETHSDHILNGIRLAAVIDSHPLRREDVIINHLSLANGAVQKEQIEITDRGNLSSRPHDFFDQAERDIAAIVKSRFPVS